MHWHINKSVINYSNYFNFTVTIAQGSCAEKEFQIHVVCAVDIHVTSVFKSNLLYIRRTHVIRTLRGRWLLFELLEFSNYKILGLLTLFYVKMTVFWKNWHMIFRKLFLCDALLINHWQYFSQCRPFFLLWIFKCKNV